MNLKLLFFMGLAISLSLCGCNNVKTIEDQNGANLMKYNENKEGFYERDLGADERYLTNQSSTNYINLSERRPNIGTDQDKIREVIQTFGDLEPGSVFINGNNVYVTVHSSNDNYTKEERDHLRDKLLNKITQAMPRYEIHVRVH